MATSSVENLPPLPAGFTLDPQAQQQARLEVPPLPPGFTLDEPPNNEPVREPVQTPERQALVNELRQREAAAQEAGDTLKRREVLAGIARPALRGAVDLADGVLSLPKLAASVPIGALNLAGANIRSPLSFSLKELGSDRGKSLQPRNDNEQLATTVTQGLGGVLGGVGIGGLLARGAGASAGVGESLAANPGLQTAGAATGGVASDLARRAGFKAPLQIAAGVLGGMIPSVAVQAANKVASGLTRTPEAQRLIDAGVDLTPGQLNPKGFANQLEETVQSAPFVGPIVRSARENARSSFQRAAAEAGAAPGTRIQQADDAAQMLDDAYQSFQPLYDQAKGFPIRPAILNSSGPNIPLDRAISSAVASRAVRATADDRAAVQGFLDDQFTKPLQSSDDLLNIRSAVRAESRAASASGQAAQAQLLDDADSAITQALDSQLPPDALRALRTADSKYGDYKTLEKAVYTGSTKPGGFTPFDLFKAVKQSNRGENQGSYARGGGGPLRELAEDATKSMEVRAPSTGQRLAALPVATVGAPAILALAGTQTGRRIAQGVTAPQQALQPLISPVAADPYAEQLALALQQAAELQKRRQAEQR